MESAFNIGSKVYGAYSYETEREIVSFATLGSKNYSLTTDDGQSVVKARGFTLKNAQAKKTLNHDVMCRLLAQHLDGVKESVRVENFNMKLCRKQFAIYNTRQIKEYRNDVFDKRFIPSAEQARAWGMEEEKRVCTLPFGLKHLRFADCPATAPR